MTLDENAAKVLGKYYCVLLTSTNMDEAIKDVAAFGRRCAEAMREECAKQVPTNWTHSLLTGKASSLGQPPYYRPDVEKLLQGIAQAIELVEVK